MYSVVRYLQTGIIQLLGFRCIGEPLLLQIIRLILAWQNTLLLAVTPVWDLRIGYPVDTKSATWQC